MDTATLGVGVPNTFQWEDLPTVIADLILEALARQLRCITRDVSRNNQDMRDAMHRARLVNHAFADAVGYLWKLLPPVCWFEYQERDGSFLGRYEMRPDATPGFVEGVMRLAADAAIGRFLIHPHTFSMIYTTVCSSATLCRTYNRSEQLYNAIGTVASTLVAGGAFQQLDTAEKRDCFVKFVSHCFKYLDKYYTKIKRVRNIEVVLREALVTG